MGRATRRQRQRAFSLLEITVVCAVIGVLTTIGVLRFSEVQAANENDLVRKAFNADLQAHRAKHLALRLPATGCLMMNWTDVPPVSSYEEYTDCTLTTTLISTEVVDYSNMKLTRLWEVGGTTGRWCVDNMARPCECTDPSNKYAWQDIYPLVGPGQTYMGWSIHAYPSGQWIEQLYFVDAPPSDGPPAMGHFHDVGYATTPNPTPGEGASGAAATNVVGLLQ